MRTEPSALLLDTHVWIWFNEGLPELSEQLRQLVDYAAQRGEVWVSIVSVWEVSLLYSKQRLRLEASCLDWVQRALAPPLALAALTPGIAVDCIPCRAGSTAIRRIASSPRPRGSRA